MDNKKLVAICRHELRLEEDYDIARLIREVKIVQEDSSDKYARLAKEHRIKAREIMSGYMLAWEYVEDLNGSGYGQRFWSGKRFRPDALIWPEDKKKWILAGVEKMFNELQDYSIIDRQKRKSRLTTKICKEADTGEDPFPPGARSTIRPHTKQSGSRDKQPKTDVNSVPDHAALTAQVTELGEEASRPKEEPKKAAGMESYNVDPKTQLEGPVTDESADKSVEESPSRRRALTPPYIPEKGLHQTWPAFGFKSVSREGARALRNRAVQIDDSEESPSRTILMTPHGFENSSTKANRKQDSAEKYLSTVPAERSEDGHINTQDSKRIRKGRLPSLPNSLLTRHQAASAKAIDKHSPTSEDESATGRVSLSAISSSDGRAVQVTAGQRSQKLSDKTASSPRRA